MDKLPVQYERALYLAAKGNTARESALELGISEQSVKNYLLIVRRILNAKSTTHAVFIYFMKEAMA